MEGTATILTGAAFPPSLFFTVPAVVAANFAALKFKKDVKKWNDCLTSETGMQDFLYNTGGLAHRAQESDPKEWTDEAIKIKLQKSAEAAAASLATRDGKHSKEDVYMLLRYVRSAAYWFSMGTDILDAAMGGAQQDIENEVKSLLQFIRDAKIESNKDLFLQVARHHKKQR